MKKTADKTTKNVKTKTERNSSIELLRIITMILITMHHYALYTGLIITNTFAYSALIWGGKIGVQIFILISGYFLIKSEFKAVKIIKLWLQVFMYSVLLMLFDVFILNNPITISEVIGYFTPIVSYKYGFISNYMLLYLLSPFYSKMLKSLNKTQHEKFIFVAIGIFVIGKLVINSKVESIENMFGFFVIFSIGAYIRLYGIKILDERKLNKSIMILIAIVALYILNTYIYYTKIGLSEEFPTELKNFLMGGILGWYGNSIFTVVCSTLIFYIFSRIKIKKDKIVNYIASASLAVFLIEEHPLLQMPIWNQAIKINTKEMGILQCIIATIMIYVLAICIDTVRKLLIEKPVLILMNKSKKINNEFEKINKWMNE